MSHNRLKLMRFYLVGPMDHDRESGREWREEMTDWLINTRRALPMDPYHKPMLDLHADGLEDDDNYAKRKEAIATGRFDEARELTKPLRHVDLRMVDHSDAIIVNLDKDKHPCGTFEELFQANREKKPCIIHCPQGKKEVYDWLYGTLPHEIFFENWSDVKEYLRHIDEDENIDTLDRWLFFNMEPLIRRVLSLDGTTQSIDNHLNI